MRFAAKLPYKMTIRTPSSLSVKPPPRRAVTWRCRSSDGIDVASRLNAILFTAFGPCCDLDCPTTVVVDGAAENAPETSVTAATCHRNFWPEFPF